MHRSLVDAACTVRCAIVLARTPSSSLRHDVLRRAVASYDVSPAGCSTGQPAMAQEVNYIRQHGVDGVPRSPEEKSMHFYSGFYHRSERTGAEDAVQKFRFLSGALGAHPGLERVNTLRLSFCIRTRSVPFPVRRGRPRACAPSSAPQDSPLRT